LIVLPLLWPKIKSLFGGGDKSKTVGAGISVDETRRSAIIGFTREMLANGKNLALTQKAYENLVKSQGRTPEELDELNKSIVSALDRKIEVQSGAHQRVQGIDKSKDVENSRAIYEQIKTLGEVSTRLDEFSKNYKAAETAKKKAQAERDEETRREQLTNMANALSQPMMM